MTVLFLTLPASRFAYLVLALLVGGESAGVPLPGETALITGGVLASQDKLSLPIVIAVAALAAIVGDNIGFQIGRRGGRRLLARPGRFEDRRRAFLERGEEFFQRHGGKTVFLGRWLPFLRVTAALLAGAHGMPWPRFLVWNAAGGIAWAVTVSLVGYYAGHAAADAISRYGLLGAGVIVVLALLAAGSIHLWRRRVVEES